MKIEGIVQVPIEAVLNSDISLFTNGIETLSILLFVTFIAWSVKLVFE